MEGFRVPVEMVLSVEDHPNADRLSIVTLQGGQRCISAKLDDGTPRYSPGSRVVFCPHGAKIPEWLLRRGFWDDEKGHGFLGGPNHDVVESRKIRGEVTEGILFSVDAFDGFDPERHFVLSRAFEEDPEVGLEHTVGDDVADLLEIRHEELSAK